MNTILNNFSLLDVSIFNNFLLLDVYLYERFVKIQLPNIFKDHHTVSQPRHTTVDYDEWPISLALWRKCYNIHGKYKPELKEYFHMYRCQLNFAMFCVTSALGISWQHLNHPNLLVRSVYRIYVYFHTQLILHEFGISLPHDAPDETWMHGDWFYTTDYGIFGHEVKTTERSTPKNLT